VHSAIDIGALTRDFTKWDDQPTSLQHFDQRLAALDKTDNICLFALARQSK
jgi:hypothetical protein